MRSKFKLQKCSNNLPCRQYEDRLSHLPTCLIVKIISFLPIKDAAVTSALSKHWKQLWTFVTTLDFDEKTMGLIPSSKGFKRIVNRVLLLRDKSCLQIFRLKCIGRYDGSLVSGWIASILQCNIQELFISVPIKQPVFWPSNIFRCKNLVVLKLDAEGKVKIPTSISLPNLKTFHLDRVELSDDVSLVCLLSGCPVLEELKLSRCIGSDVHVINITSSTLTSLTLEFLACDFEKRLSIPPMNYQIVVDTPSLQYISVIDCAAKGYVVNKLHYLIEADISIKVSEFGAVEMHNKVLFDIFNAISPVRTLSLSSRSMEAISWLVFALPEFSNLTELVIFTDNLWTSNVLTTLLEKSPRLEILHFVQFGCNKNHLSGLTHNVPSCVRSHLKIIKIDGFAGVKEEMEMVEFLLKNAQVLERLSLRYPTSLYDTGEEATFLCKLMTFPRASTTCRVDVV